MNNTIRICGANKQQKSYHGVWALLLLAATVRSFAHMPLGISDRNTTYCEETIDDYMNQADFL